MFIFIGIYFKGFLDFRNICLLQFICTRNFFYVSVFNFQDSIMKIFKYYEKDCSVLCNINSILYYHVYVVLKDMLELI